MSLLSIFWFAALLLCHLGVAAYTYTIDKSCLDQFPAGDDGLSDTFKEVISNAGEFANALDLRNMRYNDIMQ